MTSRERVNKAIRFDSPDMIPIDYWVLPATCLRHGRPFFGLLDKFPKDFPETLDEDNPLPESHRKGDYTDAFGAVWRQEYDGFLGQISKHPLEDAALIATYEFPPPEGGETTLEQTKNIIAEAKPQHKFIAADFIRTFERMHFLRGMENTLMDMALGRDEFHKLLDRVAEWNMAHLAALLDTLGGDIDGVWFSDDWGTQTSLLIRPDSWRKFFKPRYAEMFDIARGHGKSVFFHSDGFIMDIIGDLIEIGCDVLNCQVELLGSARLAENFGGRITFHTDLDRQNILPFGTPGDIQNHVKSVVETLGSQRGGLILCAELGPDMPFENIETLIESFDRERMQK